MENTKPSSERLQRNGFLLSILVAISLLTAHCNNSADSSVGNGVDSTGLKAKDPDTATARIPDSVGKNDTANKVATPPLDTFGPKKK